MTAGAYIVPEFAPPMTRRTLIRTIAALLLVEGVLLACLSAGLFGVYAGVLTVVILTYAAVVEKPSVPFFIALLPISQPLPIPFGGRSIGVSAEFIVIPALAVHLLVNRIHAGLFDIRRREILAPSLLFLALAALSLIRGISMAGISEAAAGIGTMYNFVLALLLFVVLSSWMSGTDKIAGIVTGLLASFLLISVVGVIEYAIHTPEEGVAFRATSLFGTIFWKEGGGNPNVFGTYLMIMSLIAVVMRPHFHGWRRALATVSIPFGVVAMIFSSSRSATLGFLFSLLVVSGVSWRRLALWSLPVFAAIVAVIQSIPRLANRIRSIYDVATDPRVIRFFASIDPRRLDWNYIHYFGIGGYNIDLVAGALRIPFWINGVRIFLQYPVLGVGLKMNGRYGAFDTAENLLLDLGVMMGLLGLGVFLWFLMRILKLVRTATRRATTGLEKSYVRAYRASLFGCAFVSLTGSVLFSLKLLILLSVLTAMVWAIGSKEQTP
jgi:hypothetical protein